jgi:hypothetical protein
MPCLHNSCIYLFTVYVGGISSSDNTMSTVEWLLNNEVGKIWLYSTGWMGQIDKHTTPGTETH